MLRSLGALEALLSAQSWRGIIIDPMIQMPVSFYGTGLVFRVLM